MRRLICILLLLVLPLHGFAMQAGWGTPVSQFDLAHELDHAAGASHHHDEHGSTHYDESGKSSEHAAEHSTAHNCVALPTDTVAHPPAMAEPLASSEWQQAIPDPFLEGPQRPPSSLG